MIRHMEWRDLRPEEVGLEFHADRCSKTYQAAYYQGRVSAGVK